MQTEIEVKFLDIDIAAIRERLRSAGAHLEQPTRAMRRALIEQPHHAAENSFIRVRDEGDKVTLTFKRRADARASKIDSVTEIEVQVSSFEDTVELLREAGWGYKTFQESKRETWTLDDAEIVIDEWPWVKPYIEIEAANETIVRSVAERLALNWGDVVFGHIDAVYENEYVFAEGFRGVIDLKEVRFGDDLPAGFIPRQSLTVE